MRDAFATRVSIAKNFPVPCGVLVCLSLRVCACVCVCTRACGDVRAAPRRTNALRSACAVTFAISTDVFNLIEVHYIFCNSPICFGMLYVYTTNTTVAHTLSHWIVLSGQLFAGARSNDYLSEPAVFSICRASSGPNEESAALCVAVETYNLCHLPSE